VQKIYSLQVKALLFDFLYQNFSLAWWILFFGAGVAHPKVSILIMKQSGES